MSTNRILNGLGMACKVMPAAGSKGGLGGGGSGGAAYAAVVYSGGRFWRKLTVNKPVARAARA
jgi:hypothetical protein